MTRLHSLLNVIVDIVDNAQAHLDKKADGDFDFEPHKEQLLELNPVIRSIIDEYVAQLSRFQLSLGKARGTMQIRRVRSLVGFEESHIKNVSDDDGFKRALLMTRSIKVHLKTIFELMASAQAIMKKVKPRQDCVLFFRVEVNN